MTTNTEFKTPIELLNRAINNENDSKKILRYLSLSSNAQHLVEDVLEYTLNGNLFFQNDDTIALNLGVSPTSIGNIINKLKTDGFLKTNTKANMKSLNEFKGSRRYMWVDLPKLITVIVYSNYYQKRYKEILFSEGESENRTESLIEYSISLIKFNFDEAYVKCNINKIRENTKPQTISMASNKFESGTNWKVA
jgi:transcription initiation factor IIE alpha subunit